MAISREELRKKLAADRAATDAQTAETNRKVVNADSGLEGLQSSQVPSSINRIGSAVGNIGASIENVKQTGGLVSRVPEALTAIGQAAGTAVETTGIPAAGRFIRDITVGAPKPEPIGTLQGQSAQRAQASAGTAGTTTGDSSGTGANTPTRPVVPSSATSGEVKLGQTPQGQLSIADQAGGRGTIQFADQRKLNQGQLDRLAGTIERNADPAFQQRLAQEAALSQSRYDAAAQSEAESNKVRELDFFKRAHLDALRRNDLVSVSQFANRIKELEGANLARETLGAKESEETRKLGFETSKSRTQQALEAGKQQDQLRSGFFKMLSDAEKSGTSNPLTNYSAARSAFGDTIDRRTLHAGLGSDVTSQLLESRGNLEEQVPLLQRLGFPEQDAQFILDQINQ